MCTLVPVRSIVLEDIAILIIHNAIVLKQSIVGNWTGRQNSDSAIRTAVDLMDDVLANGFTNLVRDETLPFEEPFRAYHVPIRFIYCPSVLGRCSTLSLIVSIELKV